jgi:hypothetical protein
MHQSEVVSYTEHLTLPVFAQDDELKFGLDCGERQPVPLMCHAHEQHPVVLGANNVGQSGDGTQTGHATPNQVGTATNWVAVSVGEAHTIGVQNI